MLRFYVDVATSRVSIVYITSVVLSARQWDRLFPILTMYSFAGGETLSADYVVAMVNRQDILCEFVQQFIRHVFPRAVLMVYTSMDARRIRDRILIVKRVRQVVGIRQ